MDIKRMLNLILDYQKEMGYDFAAMPLEERMQNLRDRHTALSIEQAELLDTQPWKPWQNYAAVNWSTRATVADEWMDCFFFLAGQAFCLLLSPEEIEEAFLRVLAKNTNRLLSGYSKTRKEET